MFLQIYNKNVTKRNIDCIINEIKDKTWAKGEKRVKIITKFFDQTAALGRNDNKNEFRGAIR